MTNNNLPGKRHRVKFEKQTESDTCGAACAVMVLDAIRVAHPNQDKLFKKIHKYKSKDNGINKENWASSPDGLQKFLNRYSKPNYHFKIYDGKNHSRIARRMVWTIFNYKTPCIALVNSGFHWVVVYQFKKKGKTPTGLDGFKMHDVQKFYSIDPNADVPSERGHDYNLWFRDTQYTERQGLWAHKYVVLCDPNPGDEKKRQNKFSNMGKGSGKESQGPMNEENQSSTKDPNVSASTDKPSKSESKKTQPSLEQRTGIKITRIKKPDPGHGLIDSQSAKNYSDWHLKNDGFYDPTKFTRMMVNPRAGNPMLVRSLDKDDFWWIVPFIESDNKMGGQMRINAKDARFQEAVFSMHADQPLTLPRLSKKKITEIVINKYGKPKGIIIIEDILVWKPCVQSYSMFKPFYKVKMGTRTVYVRIDGHPFYRLSQRRSH
jgi:hypothetical protein